MPHLDTEPLFKLYYEQVKDKYPSLDIDSFMTICKTPFRFIKSQIERPDLPKIFIRYFGKWTVHSSNIQKKLTKLEVIYTKNKVRTMTEEKYIEIKTWLTAKHIQLKQEEELDDRTDLRSAKNRREIREQILEIEDDTN